MPNTQTMKLEEHLGRTRGIGREVHVFLDQFSPAFGLAHRQIFHHKEGVEWICKIFGEESRWIAEKHILDDINGDTFNDPIPTKVEIEQRFSR